MAQLEGCCDTSLVNLVHGRYKIEGSDQSESNECWSVTYKVELMEDGSIEGIRDGDSTSGLSCSGWWDMDALTISFKVYSTSHSFNEWYRYQGTFDIHSKQIRGYWCATDSALKDLAGHKGTFLYSYQLLDDNQSIQLDENQNLLMKYEALHMRCDNMANVIAKLNQDVDEYKKQIHDLKQQINDKSCVQNMSQLDLQTNANVDGLKWDHNQVLNWILKINAGEFRKYKSKLKVTLKQEGIEGNQLMYLDKIDLHRLGIINFGDKIKIMQCISDLFNSSNLQDIFS